MASAVIFMQWESYQKGPNNRPFFEQEPLTFNSRQERLHKLLPGKRLWIASRCPDDQQYYLVGVLQVVGHRRNPPDSQEGQRFGEYAILADRSRSHDLHTRFPAEGLLRTFAFETGKPIKYGASLGQSLQTLRLLSASDEQVLDAALQKVLIEDPSCFDTPCGLWTKCDKIFADYFLTNWQRRQEPLAFLLYDPPPALPMGSPIFIHSDKTLRLLASFREGQFVAGHKQTVALIERTAERERIWSTYRERTINPPAKSAFEAFWEGQSGVRSLFIMDNLVALPPNLAFKQYGRALEWGYPRGVGYRYLTLSQSYLLFNLASLPEEKIRIYLNPLTRNLQLSLLSSS